MILALDTEATGLDLRHGAKPFLVTVCDDAGNQQWWEWEVNPLTRQPNVVKSDLVEIQEKIDSADFLILQSPKYDVTALQRVFKGRLVWNWRKVYCTLLAGHLLASNQPHDLTTMVLVYLGINVKPFEDEIKQATNEARRMCQGKHAKYPDFRIAHKDLPEMPSAKATVWKNDMWLPRAIAIEEGYEDDHPWRHLVSEYANSDSETTLALFLEQRRLLKKKNLWKIYEERLKILSIVYQMEEDGVTGNMGRKKELVTKYEKVSRKTGNVCVSLAKSYGYDLSLPKSNTNKSLTTFIFEVLKLPIVKASKKTGDPSLDKDVLDVYETTLPQHSKQLSFIKALRTKSKQDKALSSLKSYERFWVPLKRRSDPECLGPSHWYRLYPSLNPTGTVTLRWTSSNPSQQTVSKKEGFNLRYCFGPAPGREWWALDYNNIELRIPAYECKEPTMLKLFDNPEKPPYFGSYHLLVFDILHPEEFKRYGVEVKNKYSSTLYSWTKNGNFAVQYGAVESSGTADRAYHVNGAQKRIQKRLSKMVELNRYWIGYAEEHGYVETLPDKTVDPERGYPLWCSRTTSGRIISTIPLSYHVQGTACWIMIRAMVKVQAYLDKLGSDYKMIMNVHDEIVLDFPKGKKANLPKVQKIRKIMESIGEDVGVKLTCGIDYHPLTWSEGVSV